MPASDDIAIVVNETLRRLGDEYGAYGVALVAAGLTDTDRLVRELIATSSALPLRFRVARFAPSDVADRMHFAVIDTAPKGGRPIRAVVMADGYTESHAETIAAALEAYDHQSDGSPS